jgi:hypothetical protein
MAAISSFHAPHTFLSVPDLPVAFGMPCGVGGWLGEGLDTALVCPGTPRLWHQSLRVPHTFLCVPRLIFFLLFLFVGGVGVG